MKRSLLFGFYAVTAIAVSAQTIKMNVPRPSEVLERSEIKVEKKMKVKKTNYISVSPNQKFEVKELEGRTILPFTEKVATRADDDVQALYMLPSNDAFHYGMKKDWTISYPSIILPPAVDVIFRNYSSPQNVNSTWTLQGQDPTSEGLFGEGASNFFKVLPEMNNSYSTNWPLSFMSAQYSWTLSPVVTATSGKASDSYFYSMGATFNGKPIERKAISILAGGYTEITTSDPIMVGTYGAFSRKLPSGVEEIKRFGSGEKNSKGENCTGIISLYQKPASPLVIEGVSIHAYPNVEGNQNAVSIDDLTLQAYKVDGLTITNEVLAKAECKSVEYNSEQGTYYITFQFVADQGLLGTQPAPFTLNQTAAIEIDGFDKCDISVFVTQNENLLEGHAFGVYPSSLDYVSYGWHNQIEGFDNYNTVDFVMNLNAAYVVLTSGGEEYSLTAPTTGGDAADAEGYSLFAMYSTFPFSDPETKEEYVQVVNAPEWVSGIGIDNSIWGSEKYGCCFGFNVTCDPLTTGEGREGDIIFETVGGIQTKVHVAQGIVTSIKDVKAATIKAMINGDNLDLSYSEGITNVTINNIAGQTLATYDLPASGKYTIPATNLSQGMYILKFNNNQTIKVIK